MKELLRKYVVVGLMIAGMIGTVIAMGANEQAKNDESGNSGGANSLITIDESTGDIINLKGDKTLRALNVKIVGVSATGTVSWDTVEQDCVSVGAATTVNINPTISNVSLFMVGIQDASGSIRIGINGATATTDGFPILDSMTMNGSEIAITSVSVYNVDTVATETVCVFYTGN
jgi:hypothetical protein